MRLAPRTLRWRLAPRTLRWRLALSVAMLVACSFAITFVAVYRGTGGALSGQIDRDLAGDSAAFSRTLQAAAGDGAPDLLAAARRYVGNQPYTGSSTLLFATVSGRAPVTNQPELLSTHAPPDNGETAAEQEVENRAAAGLLRAAPGYSTLALPDVGRMRLLLRRVAVHGGPAAMVGVGEPLSSVARAQAGVARAFVLAGLLVLVCALVAAYVLGTRLSAPLRQVAGAAARVDAGDLHPRIHDLEHPPEEVRVLAEAFNHMLDRLAKAFAAQRAFVADASHELRTPLTVIRGQIELLAAEDSPSGAEVRRVAGMVQAELARIGRLVDDLLLLAKAERPELLRPQTLDLQRYVREVWEGAEMMGERRFQLAGVPAGTLSADPDRLAQALRNLLANAVEHTQAPDGLVRLGVVAAEEGTSANGAQAAPGSGGRIRFILDDNGPGISAGEREQVFDRFHRTDGARDRRSGGAGLGLAIVRAIAQAHGGSVTARSSPEGGARIELELPGLTLQNAGDPVSHNAGDPASAVAGSRR